MGKLTKAERAALEQQLADDDAADDDDDDEVEIGLGEGKYFRGKYRRAKSVAGAHGFKLEADPPAPKAKRPAAAKDEPGGEPEGDGGTVRFGRRVG
jgi:hypothetical protein